MSLIRIFKNYLYLHATRQIVMNALREIRHRLHAHPELSGQELRTSQFISDYLEDLGIRKIFPNIAQHSLVAEISGNEKSPVILFRCELDALPIEETNRTDYHSQNPGISHTCGHDGHMAIMLGFANQMVKKTPEKGRILFLFQSAEETGHGAEAVLNSGFLDKYPIEYAFSLHNMPGYNLGDIICKTGNFTPSVESITIELRGKTSHAGEPEKGINPALTITKIINFLNDIQEPDRDSPDYFIATPIQIRLGERALGTSAGHAFITYTFRAWDNSLLEQKKLEIEKKVRKIAGEKQGLDFQVAWSEPFSANINHPGAVDIIRKAAAANQLNYIEKKEPLTWGEDFGLFTRKYRGAMFGIGAGESYPALHNPNYDFPDDLIKPGVKMFVSIAEEIVNRSPLPG